ncbi:MAG: hypothetical protein B7Z37_22320 [Verrucomicrobia bacterium 12-59-8]|nr:MAG: hypothetical protein B7Z37_22320 [Verrucomicrobia bacterium 12-59-8]
MLDVVNTLSPTGYKPESTTTYKNASVGISVTSLENADDRIYVELYRGPPEGGTSGFLSALHTTAVNAEDDHEVLPRTIPSDHSAVTTGSVRLSYDPVTQLFTAYYDPDGSSNGYQWQMYGTFGVGPSGGGNMRNGLWKLTHNLGFQVSVGAFSEGLVVPGGSVYADNFAVSTSAPLPGAPDITFNGTGHATTEAGDSEGSDMSMVQQCDGKIIIATSTDHGVVDGTRDVVLRRYNADGSVDDTFNTATSAIAQNVYVLNVALQQDGKILVVGSSGVDLALLRYDKNGDLDPTFDGDGKAITDLGGSSDEGTGLIVAPDGKILVVGTNGNDLVVVRYNPGGNLDTSFGGTGVVALDFGGFEYGNSVAVQSAGGIVVSGDSEGDHAGGGLRGFVLARFLPNGTLDTSFGTNGKVLTTEIGGERGCAWRMKLDTEERIVIGGRTVNAIGQMALVRYTSDGDLDTTLDGTGIVTTGFGGSYAEGNGLAFQTNSKILVSGNATLEGDSQFALARFNLDGSLDTSFHADGRVTSYLCSPDAFASGVLVQGDGRIVLGGWFLNSSGTYDVALVRYEGDPVAYQVQNVLISKTIEHIQDSASHVIPNPTPQSETYGGPYGFSVNVIGMNILALRESPTVTGPFTAFHLSQVPELHHGGRLIYNCNNDWWRYGWPNANDWGSPTLADMDARFGSGTYTVNVEGTDVALNLTGDVYPTLPMMNLTGGTWSGGKYYIAPEQALVITSNSFSAYGTHAEDFIDAWIGGIVENPTVFASSSPGTNSVNMQVPSNTFVPGQEYNAGVEYGAVVDLNTTAISGALSAAYYSMRTELKITAMTPQQNWRWTHFGTVDNSGNAADTFDLDHDGLSNLLEWACHLNPATASSLPASIARSGVIFEFSYTRSVSALNAGAVFTVEWTDTLANDWQNTGVSETILSDDGTVQQVKATIPIGGGSRRFVHLKVMGPP